MYEDAKELMTEFDKVLLDKAEQVKPSHSYVLPY